MLKKKEDFGNWRTRFDDNMQPKYEKIWKGPADSCKRHAISKGSSDVPLPI